LERGLDGGRFLANELQRPKRLVTLRRDGDEYVVAFYPEEIIVFRNEDPHALARMCSFLRWKIISDNTQSPYPT
jgi:hypothetical protein